MKVKFSHEFVFDGALRPAHFLRLQGGISESLRSDTAKKIGAEANANARILINAP